MFALPEVWTSPARLDPEGIASFSASRMPGLKEARTRYPRFGGGSGIPRPFRALARSNSHCGQGPAETGGFCASDLQTGLISWLESGLGVALVWPWCSLDVALV
jgi:hypothetical protein